MRHQKRTLSDVLRGIWIFVLVAAVSAVVFSSGPSVGHQPQPPPVYESDDFARYIPDGGDILPTPEPTASPSPTPKPTKKPVVRATPREPIETPRARQRPSHGLLKGYATWFATGRDGYYGAAGPVLRRALGKGWRGDHVLVCKGDRCLEVILNDWCACGPRNGLPTLIDLSDEAFRWLAPLSRGVMVVRIDVP